MREKKEILLNLKVIYLTKEVLSDVMELKAPGYHILPVGASHPPQPRLLC